MDENITSSIWAPLRKNKILFATFLHKYLSNSIHFDIYVIYSILATTATILTALFVCLSGDFDSFSLPSLP